MIQLGDFKLHLINDAIAMHDAGGPFGLVPRTLWRDVFMPPTEDNFLPMTHHNLLVQAKGKNILIDVGYGSKLTEKQIAYLRLERPQGGLVASLARLDLTPGDIDLVIDTHLHSDHCGGNTAQAEDGSIIVQGSPVDQTTRQQISCSEDETAVGIPAELLLSAAKALQRT